MLARWRKSTRIIRVIYSPKGALILEAKLPRYSDIMAETVSDHLNIIMNCFPVSEALRVRQKCHKYNQIKSKSKVDPK